MHLRTYGVSDCKAALQLLLLSECCCAEVAIPH
jgi:hypothetical protein